MREKILAEGCGLVQEANYFFSSYSQCDLNQVGFPYLLAHTLINRLGPILGCQEYRYKNLLSLEHSVAAQLEIVNGEVNGLVCLHNVWPEL